MPTALRTIVNRTRTTILAPLVQTGAVAPDTFWTDAEFLAHLVAGCTDLWRAILDLQQDHFVRINTTLVLPAGATALAGVPPDCFRILHLRPRDRTDSTGRAISFRRARLTSIDFTNALDAAALDVSSGGRIFYALINAGSPVDTPEIHVAPSITSDLPIRLVYVPTLPALTLDSVNPIPGESDNALMAWCAAYALGKQNPDGTLTPDPTWLGVYSTEKESIKIVVEPRDTSSPSIIRGALDEITGPGLSGDGTGWDW